MCGFSVWHHPLVVDPDTLRTEIAPFGIGQQDEAYVVGAGGVQRWPISAVGYTAYPMSGVIGYYAIAMGGRLIQLPRPGETSDEWTVVGRGDQPHLGGSIVALDMAFTGGMLSWRARLNLAKSAGRASPVLILPDKIPVRTTDAEGKPVQGIGEDAADTVAGLGSEHTGAVFPFGSTLTKFELATVGAAEYFHQELLDLLLLIMLAVIGRGGGLAKMDAQYQGPTEMDVPESLVRRDVEIFERAANGIFAMLTRKNAGAGVSPPKLCGHLPDADQIARRKSEGEALIQVAAILKAEGDAGCAITQDRANAVTRLVAGPGVPAPVIAAESPARVLEWHVQQKVVAPDQALAALGLPALPGGAGSVERLAAERLAGKDESGKPASQGDATVDTTPPTVDGPEGDGGAAPRQPLRSPQAPRRPRSACSPRGFMLPYVRHPGAP